jgi:hypothetical protein
MLKLILLTALSLVFFSPSFSQINYGIRGGITQSFIKEESPVDGTEFSKQTGFQFGFFLDKEITDKITFRPALQLTQKGYQSVVGIPIGPFYWSRNLSTTYLELPIDIIYHFNLSNSTRMFIGTGPVVGYGLFGTLNTTLVTTDINQQLKYQSSTYDKIFRDNQDNRFDFGWNANIGLNSCKLLFTLSYNHGLSNVTKDELQSLKNRSFAFTVGYLLK